MISLSVKKDQNKIRPTLDKINTQKKKKKEKGMMMMNLKDMMSGMINKAESTKRIAVVTVQAVHVAFHLVRIKGVTGTEDEEVGLQEWL